MPNEFRPLTVLADGTKIAEDLRVRVQGSLNMTLLPDFFIIEIYNLSDGDLTLLRNAKELVVNGKDDYTICLGEISDIYGRDDGPNTITAIAIVDGKKFGETKVNKTLGGGTDVRSTILNLIENAKFGGFNATDRRIPRGQTYSGLLSENISMLAKSCNARAFITKNVVYVSEKGKASEIISIVPDDIVNDTSAANGIRIIRTDAKGYPVGAIVRMDEKDYRLVTQKLNLDNLKGEWSSSIILIDEKELSDEGMVGG